MESWVGYLPHLNAILNGTATILLILALGAIKSKRETLHKQLMFAALGVSGVFLISYLTRMALAGNKLFPRDDYSEMAFWAYALILGSHVLLAMTVPFLAGWAVWLGVSNQRAAHRRLVRWAYPIWLYVSLTGVVVYFMLYWWFVPLAK
jgi:putative membrane protein